MPFSCLQAQQQQQQHNHQHMHAHREVIPFHLHNSSSSSIEFNNSSSSHELAAAAVTGVRLISPSDYCCSQLCSHSCPSSSSSSSVPCGAAGAGHTVSAAAGLCPPREHQAPNQQDVDTDVEMTDADELQQAAAAAAKASAPPAWADLPEGLLGRVAACLGSSVAAVMPMYTACRCGRAGCSGVWDAVGKQLVCSLDPGGAHCVLRYMMLQHGVLEHCHVQRSANAAVASTLRCSCNMWHLIVFTTTLSCASPANAVAFTCRAWRRAVLDDDRLLLGLRFSLIVTRPFKPAPAQHYRWHASARQQHPALLLRVSKPGVDSHTSFTHWFRICRVCCMSLPITMRPACLFSMRKHSGALLLT
jgi:hypothetical protein